MEAKCLSFIFKTGKVCEKKVVSRFSCGSLVGDDGSFFFGEHLEMQVSQSFVIFLLL